MKYLSSTELIDITEFRNHGLKVHETLGPTFSEIFRFFLVLIWSEILKFSWSRTGRLGTSTVWFCSADSSLKSPWFLDMFGSKFCHNCIDDRICRVCRINFTF